VPATAWIPLALPLLLARDRPDVFWGPRHFMPLALPRRTAAVVTLHDLTFLRYPRTMRRLRAPIARALVPRGLRRARRIITDAQSVRDELRALPGLAGAKIEVVPLGVGPEFRPAVAAEVAEVRARYGLERPYVLAVGTDSPRKNLALLDAIAPRLANDGVEVVIAGSTRPYLPAGPAPQRARRLGYVADTDLPALYAGAAAFAMPSLYEGFGLPCLEAMAAGTPVVAADRAALPEACAGAALLADPLDAAAFAAALQRAAGPERERLVAAGRERAGALTWRRTAEELDAALEPLLATGG
jgi:alpha-1,3-rhamnosyl/mannosyltransferase